MDDISITTDTIKLGQLLKLANFIDQGGEAKAVLASGAVRVNGESETRRGRVLARGDVVTLGAASVRLA